MSGRRPIPPHERGAALLTVLLLVAVMGAISAAALEKLRLSTALAVNSAGIDRARAFAIGLESLLTLTVDDLTARSPERTTLTGGWNGAVRQYPLPGGGLAEATVRDGGNCFNINSLVEERGPGLYTKRPLAIGQFVGLMRVLEVPEATARSVAEAAADWADSDAEAGREGAEDPQYAGAPTPYRTGNTMFAEVSELRAVAGVTPELYGRVRPWLCALPTTELSSINVNTLLPDQAPLLAMLAPEQFSVDRAGQVIAERPAQGWDSLVDFWEVVDLNVPLEVQFQTQLRTRWFAMDLRIALDGAQAYETALIDARRAPSRLAVRRWGNDD